MTQQATAGKFTHLSALLVSCNVFIEEVGAINLDNVKKFSILMKIPVLYQLDNITISFCRYYSVFKRRSLPFAAV